MEALKYAYNQVKDDKRALVGQFITYHEVSYFSSKLFSLSTPVEIIDELLKHSIPFYERESGWENPEDIFETNPITGESKLTDDEIKEKALNVNILNVNVLNNKEDVLIRTVDNLKNADQVSGIQENEPSYEIRKSRQFIDFYISIPNSTVAIGETTTLTDSKRYTYPTLLRKWANLDASLKLLELGGVKLEKPTLKGEEQDREAVIAILTKTHQELLDTLKYSFDKAKISFGVGSDSYTSTYQEKFNAIEREMAKVRAQPETSE